MLRANAGVHRINNFGLTGNEPADQASLFIINFLNILGAEIALLWFSSHN